MSWNRPYRPLALVLAQAMGLGVAWAQCTANGGGDVAGCEGSAIILNGSATGIAPFTYSWSPSTGLSSTSEPSPTLTVPGADATYTLTITDSGGCVSSAEVKVVVLPPPDARLAATGTARTETYLGKTTFIVCAPASSWTFDLMDQSAPYPGSTRTLDLGDGSPPLSPAAGWTLSHTYPVGLHTITYTIAYPNGCGHTSSYQVFLGAMPPPPAVSTNSPVCIGQTISLAAVPSPGLSFAWSGPNGFTSNQSTVTIPGATTGHSGIYSVVASRGACRSAPTPVDVQVIASAPVTVTPSSATICTGDMVTLTAGGANTYQWYIGTTHVGTGAVFNASPAVTTTYTISGILGSCPGSTTITVVVNQLPLVDAGPPLTFCDQPIAETLTGTPAAGVWSGPIVTAGGSFTPIPDSLGLFPLTYTYTDGHGCVNSATVDITVVPPVFAKTGPDSTVCQGGAPVRLPASPPGGTWYGTAPDGSFDPVAPGEFTLTYTYGTGSCATSDAGLVRVLPLPSLTVEPDFGVCANLPAVPLTATPANGAWSGAGTSGPPYGFDPGTVPPGQHALTYTFTGTNGCTASATSIATVFPLPVAAFSHDPIACAGQPLAFVNSSTGATGWQWSFGDGGTSTDRDPAHGYAGTGNWPVTLTATNAYGCSDTFHGTATVHGTPSASFALGTTTGCGPLDVALTNTSAGDGAQYLWDFGGLGTATDRDPAPYTFPADPFGIATYAVTLRVTNTCGTDATSAPVTVMPTPTADFSHGAATHCSHADVLFTNNSHGLPDSFRWDFGDGNSSGEPNPTVVHAYRSGASVAVPYTVSLVAGNACGMDTARKTITILPNQVNAAFNPSTTRGCGPLAVGLTQLSTGDTAWHWDFGDGTTSALREPVHTFTTPGTYTIHLTAFGCGRGDHSVDLTVLAPPQAAFTHTPASACAGGPISFTDLTAGAVGQVWDFGDGGTSGLAAPTHAYASGGTYTVTLTVTAANGCTGTATRAITVLDTPTAAFTPDPGSGCTSLDVLFRNTSADAASHAWDFGNGATSTLREPRHVFAITGTYTVTLVATHANGCRDTATAQVTAHPLPQSAFTLSAQQSCVSPATVRAVNNSQGASAYAWDFGNGQVSTLAAPDITFATPGSYTISLTAVNVFGCTSTSSAVFTVHPTPVADFDRNLREVCAGSPIAFTHSSANSGSFRWWFGDGGSSTAASPTHTYRAAGTYDVTLVVTGAGGCTDTLTVPGAVVVHPTPVADFSHDVSSGTPNVVRFTNRSTGASEHVWDFGDGEGSGDRDPAHLFTADGGRFTVCMEARNAFGCASTLCAPISVRGAPGVFMPNAFTPDGDGVNDVFLPVYDGFQDWSVQLMVFNRRGQLVFETNRRDQGWDGRYNGGAEADPGVYVWKLVLTGVGDVRDLGGHLTLLR